MTLDPEPERITVRIKEACRITGIGRSKLYELIAEGEIDIVKIGAMTLIPVDSLKALTEGRRQRR
ncbi:DNA-binding protein [Sphingobium terrigena]|jgi:excisionase family DNA binding protein|uniref:DNA-binding protein n=1 Tax=Sphingobium terrigena TaxID=2304063 RepID=A0A418YPY6_9SPHN|nr:helix-turn-helix domain-containing protein [Sphingobium terrigena]RJG53478.1 DNA-binding protein [Sphingobium terrigena]